MSQLPVSINGKVFNINCPDEEKENVLALAEYVNQKINLVAPKCKTMSEASLLSFTLLAVADDIFSKNEKIESLEKALLSAEKTQKSDVALVAALESAPIDENSNLSDDVYAKIQMAIEGIKSITHSLETADNNIPA